MTANRSTKRAVQGGELFTAQVADLVPYARNARTHTDAQVAKVAASIREFGFLAPVVVGDDGSILAGHCRIEAARKVGLQEVPAISASHLSDAQQRAYILADNRIAMDAGWDDDLLRLELAELKDADLDVEITGFELEEIDALIAEGDKTDGQNDGEQVPEPPDDPVTRSGDVWILGKNRLICGDSTSAEDVETLLAGAKPHLMITDPPYGVEYDPRWREEAGVNKNKGKMGKVSGDHEADWSAAYDLFPGDIAYVWHAGIKASVVQASLERSGFTIRSQIIWAKDRFALSRGHYHWQHEPCWYAFRRGGHWHGDRSQTTLWSIPARDDSGLGHGTQKPLECMRRPMMNNSKAGQPVYDPFCGSGTTLIAGEKEARPLYAVEIDPAYCDVIVRRWQDFTGEKAIRESDGSDFDSLVG